MHEDLIKKHLKREKDLNAPSLGNCVLYLFTFPCLSRFTVPGVANHAVRISLKSLEGDLTKVHSILTYVKLVYLCCFGSC